MASPSKKDQIAIAALPLFLDNGIKGTSVDLVVKESGVSKPTVYNHFPDKASLLTHAIHCWLGDQGAPELHADTLDGVLLEIEERWLTNEAVKLYGLLMGEGYRAGEAVALYKSQFDSLWRQALGQWASRHQQEPSSLNEKVSHFIVKKLL